MTEATSRGQNRTAGAAGGAESPKDLPVAGLFDRLRSSKRGLRRDVRPSLTRCVGSGGAIIRSEAGLAASSFPW